MSRTGRLLCVFLFVGICMGVVTATAREPERDNKDYMFGTDHHWWMLPWWRLHRFHPKYPSAPPPHTALSPAPSPVDNAVLPPHTAPSPSPVNNAPPRRAPSPSPVNNAVLPPHTVPSPSPVNNTLPRKAPSPSPSPVDNSVLLPHKAPSPSPVEVLPPSLSPSPSSAPIPAVECSIALIKGNGCGSGLLTSFIKGRFSLSTECCNTISSISDDCFYRAFTHFRASFFLGKVRHYCSTHQG